MDGVPPVFVREDDIPEGLEYPTVLDICLAVERSVGKNTIAGSQRLGGLWRIYPTTIDARNAILIRGFSFRGTSLKVSDINPNILKNSTTGEEVPATKVWVDGVPLSVSDAEIENALVKIGCEIRSTIKRQRARDNDGKLTRFLTGRRFLFITTPPKPLERKLPVCNYNASVFHIEQKNAKKEAKCSNCLETGHHRSVCANEVVCISCRLPGHKKGSEQCQLAPDTHYTAGSSAREEQDQQVDSDPRGASYAGAVAVTTAGATAATTDTARKNGASARGREPVRNNARQKTLDHFQVRSRSSSTKRPMSDDGGQRAEKAMRLEDRHTDDPPVENVNEEENCTNT